MHNVEQRVMRKLHTNFEHVAATAYHYTQRGQGLKPGTLTLEHISTHDFKSFSDMLEKALTSGSTTCRVPQVVQRFVYSKSSKNQVLKCEWARSEIPGGQPTCYVERAYNIHTMYDPRVELSDRIHTFEKVQRSDGAGSCSVVDSDIPDVIHVQLHEAVL